MVLSVQCTLQDEVNTREGIILLTLVSGFIIVSGFICILYKLISNILILNGKRFSFHVDVRNRQDQYLFLLSE
jgi:hypothetical protein